MNKRMLNLSKIVVLGLLLSFTTIDANAPTWNIDNSHTSISFEVTHFFTPVAGSFKNFDGTLNFDPENLAGSSADFTVQIASVETDNEKRNGHLQSEDFFYAKKYPEMKFRSSSFTKNDDGYILNGNLTIRDISKEISIPVKVLGIGEHPMKKSKLITAMRAEFTLNRNDYGVGSGSWAATAVVGDEVKISVLLEANRNK
ncbi:MAG: YceI family protein [Thiotrichaceae bacterium]|nr:YceI family protein [Thiotrichaceae bacterium]